MSRGCVWCAVWLSVHAALAGKPPESALSWTILAGTLANAAAAAVLAATGGSGPWWARRGERVGAAPGGASEVSGGCGRGCGCGGMACRRFSLVSLGLGWFWAGFREKPS